MWYFSPSPVRGQALDIGGSRARLYLFEEGSVVRVHQIWLPDKEPGEVDLVWGARRVEAICQLITEHFDRSHSLTLPTSCAGRKDEEKRSVVLSFYGSPLPDLVGAVERACGVQIGELLDDDICAGWGHLASPNGGLTSDSPDTVLLTAGTGLAECLWVGGEFLPKASYPRAAELGLEAPLRAQAWRDGPLPLQALQELLERRRTLAPFERLVLSGRFAASELDWPEQLADGTPLVVRPLEEAPALGALTFPRQLPR